MPQLSQVSQKWLSLPLGLAISEEIHYKHSTQLRRSSWVGDRLTRDVMFQSNCLYFPRPRLTNCDRLLRGYATTPTGEDRQV